MERIFLVYMGFALLMLWCAGLVTRTAGWLYWSFGAVALLSFIGSYFPNRLVTAAVSFGLGAWMLVLWIIAMGVQNGSWMTYWPAPFALFYFVLGASSAYLWLHPDRATHRIPPPTPRTRRA